MARSKRPRHLNPGDLLVAYSDGVTECRNSEDQEFEMDRLTAATVAVSGISANKALFSLLGTVLDFAASCSPNDDLTVLVVRCLDAPKKKQPRQHAKDISAPEAPDHFDCEIALEEFRPRRPKLQIVARRVTRGSSNWFSGSRR